MRGAPQLFLEYCNHEDYCRGNETSRVHVHTCFGLCVCVCVCACCRGPVISLLLFFLFMYILKLSVCFFFSLPCCCWWWCLRWRGIGIVGAAQNIVGGQLHSWADRRGPRSSMYATMLTHTRTTVLCVFLFLRLSLSLSVSFFLSFFFSFFF